MKQITEVTIGGIEYIDEDGNPRFLDFEICYQNFITNRQKEMGFPYNEALMEIDRKYRPVGYRRFSRLYIEFFTLPPIRFEFSSLDKFSEITHKIRKAGWLTIDGD